MGAHHGTPHYQEHKITIKAMAYCRYGEDGLPLSDAFVIGIAGVLITHAILNFNTEERDRGFCEWQGIRVDLPSFGALA